MKQVKTYQYKGLYEWHGNIHMNGLEMALSFTGGNETAYGISPASYTTDNKNIQRFIEHSDEYRIGRIKLSHVTDVEDEEPAEEEETEAEAASTAADTSSAPVDESGEAEVVQVSDMDEAKTYLCENHGYKRADLRSKVQFDAACKASGVRFDIADEQ